MWLEVAKKGGEVGELILGPPSPKLQGHSGSNKMLFMFSVLYMPIFNALGNPWREILSSFYK